MTAEIETETNHVSFIHVKTPEGKTAFLAAYDAAMKLWPLPYEELDIPGRFGTTHVVVCGPKDAPPLVLLHGYMATSAMWSPNIVDFSKDYRVYAIDTMGSQARAVLMSRYEAWRITLSG